MYGQHAKLKCGYDGKGIKIQYIAWTKIVGAKNTRMFVYEFSPNPFYNESYNDLSGRAWLEMTQSINFVTTQMTFKATPESNNVPALPTKRQPSKTIRRRMKGRRRYNQDGGFRERENFLPPFPVRRRPLSTTVKPPATTSSAITTTTEEIADFLNSMRDSTRRTTSSLPNEHENGSGEPHFERQRSFSHHAILHIDPVEMNDEAYYECLIKPVGGPAFSSVKKMNVRGNYECIVNWYYRCSI